MDTWDYDLTGVTFMEVEVELTRVEKVVFAVIDDGRGLGVFGQPSQKVGSFMRTLNYWIHSAKNLAKGEKAALKSWRFLEHDQNCEMWNGVEPGEPSETCDCRSRILKRCEPGSLNSRRIKP